VETVAISAIQEIKIANMSCVKHLIKGEHALQGRQYKTIVACNLVGAQAKEHLKNYYNFKWLAEIWLPLVRSHVCVWCYCNGIKIKCLLYLVRFMMLLLLSVYVIRVKPRTGRL
jgi:hypothetical protein